MKNDYNEAYQKSLSRTNQGDGLDFWATPPQATEALLNMEDFSSTILEPACGDGSMSEVLCEKYKEPYVISMDIVDRGYSKQRETMNFLEMPDVWFYNNVITNPPFNLAEEFIWKALEVATEKVAMLLKLEFLQAIGRYDLFKGTPLKKVLIFSYRVPFRQSGYEEPITNQRHAWYIWEHGHEGLAEIDFIKKPEKLNRHWWK